MHQQDIAREIAANVRQARKHLGLSRKRLAAAADVSERYLTDLENGAANASIGILARIAGALKVNFASLMPGPVIHGAADNSIIGHTPGHADLARLIASMAPSERQAAVEHLTGWLDDRRQYLNGLTLNGLALLGLRGAGKSTIGGRLAKRHGLPFVSMTREIEARAGMTLADLFNLGGPDAYRALENEVIGELARRNGHIVLETAGGIVGNPEALEVMLGAFMTVWIKASPEEHLTRVMRQGDLRPMHGNPKALEHLKALLTSREAEYARARAILDTTGRSVEDCVAELERIAAPMLA